MSKEMVKNKEELSTEILQSFEFFKYIERAYRLIYDPIEKATILESFELHRVSDDMKVELLKKIYKSCKFLPKVAEILEILEEALKEEKERKRKNSNSNFMHHENVHYIFFHEISRQKYGEDAHRNWLSKLAFLNCGERGDEKILVLESPSRFIREWVITNYFTPEFLGILKGQGICSVEIHVDRSKTPKF